MKIESQTSRGFDRVLGLRRIEAVKYLWRWSTRDLSRHGEKPMTARLASRARGLRTESEQLARTMLPSENWQKYSRITVAQRRKNCDSAVCTCSSVAIPTCSGGAFSAGPAGFSGVEIAVAGMNATGQALRIGDALEEPVQLIALFFTERGTKVLAVRTGRAPGSHCQKRRGNEPLPSATRQSRCRSAAATGGFIRSAGRP